MIRDVADAVRPIPQSDPNENDEWPVCRVSNEKASLDYTRTFVETSRGADRAIGNLILKQPKRQAPIPN